MSRSWRIYYTDGSTFSSDDGEPWESPSWGAALVVQPEVVGMDTLYYGNPFFLHRTDLDQWFNVDDTGLIDQFAHFAHVIDCVRPSRWMPTVEWKELMRRAAEEKAG